jgi:hypothetical protein
MGRRKHPNNGGTFTKAPPIKAKPLPVEKVAALDAESARTSADEKLFRTNPAAWLKKHEVIR